MTLDDLERLKRRSCGNKKFTSPPDLRVYYRQQNVGLWL